VDDRLKKTIVQLLSSQIVKYALFKAPYLAWGPLPWFISQVVTRVLKKAIEFGILELGVAALKDEIDDEVKEVKKVVKKYDDKKTDEEKRVLDNELKKAYSDLFKF